MNEEWRTSTLGGVCEVVGGGTPSTKQPEYWGGEVVWLSPTEVVRQDGSLINQSERTLSLEGLTRSSAKLLPEGTVLVTTRASVGFTALAGRQLATNQGFQSLIPGPELISKFLMYWVQANREEFRRRAGGSTFREVSKAKVKDIPITYPPLSVQRRIVDLMEHLDSQVAGLRNECAAVERLIFVFRESHFQRWRSETPTVSFGSITKDVRRPLAVSPEETYRQIGVRSHGRGVFGKEAKTGQDLGSKKMYTVSSGDLVFNIVFAWERAVAVVPDDFEGWASSHRFPTYRRVDGGSEEFLRHFFISAWGNEELRLASPGGAGRNRTLGRKALSMIQVPQVHRDQESEFLDQIRQFGQLSISLTREQAAAEEARRTLLRSLLAQSIDIPDAYDDVLVVAS